jgi:hypothetical protein
MNESSKTPARKPHKRSEYEEKLHQMELARRAERVPFLRKLRAMRARPAVQAKARAELARRIRSLRAARRADRERAGGTVQGIASSLMEVGASLGDVARHLEHLGIRTPRGSRFWSATQVRRELDRPAIDEVAERLHHSGSLEAIATDIALRDLALAGVAIQNPPFPKKYSGPLPRRRSGEWSEQYHQHEWSLTRSHEAALADWSVTANSLPVTQQGALEPQKDRRGRVLKGRRFSRVKRKPA